MVRLSVTLPDSDMAFLDAYAASQGVEPRSAVVQRAVRLLRESELSAAYAEAWEEWAASGAAEDWEPTVDDGLF